MRKLVEYPTPSLKERDRRWAAVRKEMDARSLDCLILCGWPAMWDFNIANVAPPLPDRRQCRVQRARLSPRRRADLVHLFAGLHRLLARRAELGRRRAAQARDLRRSVADRLVELGLTGAKVGIDGLAGPLSIRTAGCRTACMPACRRACPSSASSASMT